MSACAARGTFPSIIESRSAFVSFFAAGVSPRACAGVSPSLEIGVRARRGLRERAVRRHENHPFRSSPPSTCRRSGSPRDGNPARPIVSSRWARPIAAAPPGIGSHREQPRLEEGAERCRAPTSSRERSPACRSLAPPETVELGDGERVRHRDRAGRQAARGCDRADARPTTARSPVRLEGEAGLRGGRQRQNHGDLEATVHWHGCAREPLRRDAPDAGPDRRGRELRLPRPVPRPGVYWYHPHIREDYGQELGLYGNIIVVPTDPDYWPPAHRELALTLDDILLEDGKVAPFSHARDDYVAMGRFGDVLLVGGETDLSLSAKLGEVVRFYLTNTANTRVFKVALPGARMKLVGGDSGRHEHEEFVEDVSSRRRSGGRRRALRRGRGATLEHERPRRTYPLARSRSTRASRAVVRRSSRPCGRTRSWWPSGSGLRPTSRPRRTRGSRSSPRWTRWSRGHRSSTPVRCTRRSSASGRASAPSADEADPAEPASSSDRVRLSHASRGDGAPGPGRARSADDLTRDRAGEAGRTTTHEHHDTQGHEQTTARRRRTASSGKTTWSTSTG